LPALSSLLGTVRAEQASERDVERIEKAPGVERILSELGHDSLPEPAVIEKRRIESDGRLTNGELVIMKVKMEYGMLTAFERGSEIRAFFSFDPELSAAPSGYSATTEVGGSMGVVDSGLEFTRNATDAEEELVLSAIDTDGEIDGGQVQANTAVDGFQANVTVKDPESGEYETEQHVVPISPRFDPRTQFIAGPSADVGFGVQSAAQLDSQQVQTQGLTSAAVQLVKEILVDWITGKLADEPLEALGSECDDTCSSCATYIVDLLTTCRWCISFCSAAASGVGAIICVVCFYAFCNDSVKQINCAACFACLITGDEPDLPGSTAGAALDWVWDEIPKPPAPPSVGDLPGEIWE
jgi:hypothetical protein